MASVNKVTLIGNAGRDAEVRYSPQGMAIANVSLATTSKRKDKQSGEVVEDTQWHRVTFYDKLAEIAGEYVKKGKSIYVEGRLKYGKFTDKDGIERNTTDIVAEQMQLLGGRDDGGSQQQPRQQQGAPRQTAPQGRQSAPPRQAPQQRTGTGFDDMDDSIPF